MWFVGVSMALGRFIKGRPLLRFSGILGCSLNFIYAAACDFSRVPVFS